MTELKKQKLGRGLSALLGDYVDDEDEIIEEGKSIIEVAHHNIKPGQYQPRTHFEEEKLQTLIDSIREKGVLQPLLIRPIRNAIEDYEIIAGERRWRAAKAVGLTTVPVIVYECDDQDALETALVENIQREDLNPIEEAEGYQRLIAEFNRTQDEIAKSVGKSRSHVANILRLNSLPENIKLLIQEGKISAGHGRSLINVENPNLVVQEIIEKKLNVRDVENLVRSKKQGVEKDPDTEYQRKNLEKQIEDFFNVPVSIRIKPNGGSITIKFGNFEELDEILEKIRPL